MSIAVFGTGGVGAFFGALLVRGGQDVSFVARGSQLDALRTSGIRIQSLLLGDVTIPHVRAVEHAADIGHVDLVLVCVKTNQTRAILDDLATLVGPETTIVTLQNGIESDETIAERFDRASVIPGVVYVGATLDAPGLVTHVAAGTIVVGPRVDDQDERLETVRAMLAASGQPVRVSQDIQYERWQKLIWNAAFNTVSAITGRTPRDLVSQPEARGLIVGIMREVVVVARACGVNLQESDIDPQIAWTERAAVIRTSMMVDRERQRPMETEALIGVLVRRGREHGVPTPRSDAVYALLKAIELAPSEVSGAAWLPPPR